MTLTYHECSVCKVSYTENDWWALPLPLNGRKGALTDMEDGSFLVYRDCSTPDCHNTLTKRVGRGCNSTAKELEGLFNHVCDLPDATITRAHEALQKATSR